MPWKIANSSGAIIGTLYRVIGELTVQKKCQKNVNTRGNASKRRAAHVCQEARARQQSIVVSRSFACWSPVLSEIFQTCSQLIHTRFVVVLASGLETRNQLRKRQEKNEFYFQLRPKNFLDRENEVLGSPPKRETGCWKDFVSQPRRIRNRSDTQNSLVIGCASRVDRIQLCAQFLASASGA